MEYLQLLKDILSLYLFVLKSMDSKFINVTNGNDANKQGGKRKRSSSIYPR